MADRPGVQVTVVARDLADLERKAKDAARSAFSDFGGSLEDLRVDPDYVVTHPTVYRDMIPEDRPDHWKATVVVRHVNRQRR